MCAERLPGAFSRRRERCPHTLLYGSGTAEAEARVTGGEACREAGGAGVRSPVRRPWAPRCVQALGRGSAASDHTLPARPARLCRSFCSQAAS